MKICPIKQTYMQCMADGCAVWDINRKCCGLITQPTIDASELVYWMRSKFYDIEASRHD